MGPSVLGSTINNTLAGSGAATDVKSKDQVINPFMKEQKDENEEQMTDGTASIEEAKGETEKLSDSVEVKANDDEEEPDDVCLLRIYS